MKMTLNTHQIADLLHADSCANWSRAGALALAEYLEELEDSTGEEMELDTCALRCDFAEYSSLQAWIVEHYGQPLCTAMESAGIDLDGDEDEDAIDGLIRSHIEDHGQLVEFTGGVIVSSF